MNHSRRKIRISVLAAMSVFLPVFAFAEDHLDAQMHSAVIQKVQHDHQADLSAGRIHSPSHTSFRQPASVQAGGVTAPSVASAVAAPPAAIHPNQVQQLQKKKKTPPPPPATKPKSNTAGR